MAAIKRDNPSLKSVLPKDDARQGLDKQRLGQLINLVSDIGLGSPADRAHNILGRVCQYFLSQFASAEGKKGGQFYTPTHVVRVLVEVLAPFSISRPFDSCRTARFNTCVRPYSRSFGAQSQRHSSPTSPIRSAACRLPETADPPQKYDSCKASSRVFTSSTTWG
jgi:hypothetical protein